MPNEGIRSANLENLATKLVAMATSLEPVTTVVSERWGSQLMTCELRLNENEGYGMVKVVPFSSGACTVR